MVTLRPSTTADGDRVVALWAAAVDATHGFLSAADRIAIEDEVRSFLPHAPLTLALDAAGTPVGFMLATDGHLHALFVDPAVHGRGVGRALVARALMATPALTVEVNAQNPGALAFYRRLGFMETARSPTDGAGRPYPLIHLRAGRASRPSA